MYYIYQRPSFVVDVCVMMSPCLVSCLRQPVTAADLSALTAGENSTHSLCAASSVFLLLICVLPVAGRTSYTSGGL